MQLTAPPDDLLQLLQARLPRDWTSVLLTSRSIGLSPQTDLSCELADGGRVWLDDLAISSRMGALMQETRREGVGQFFLAELRWTRGGPAALELDYEVNPWPQGWPDPTVLEYVRGPGKPHEVPPWLTLARPSGLEGTRRPPAVAALWRAQLELLSEVLPGTWTLRGKGTKLALVRERGLWMWDVIMLYKATRSGTTVFAGPVKAAQLRWPVDSAARGRRIPRVAGSP
jgi:hypothetical protein